MEGGATRTKVGPAAAMRRLLVTAAFVSLGCAHTSTNGERAGAQTKTCVVLSVGGPKGVAHLGALMALRDAQVKIDCIAGNSIGALIAGLYATAPKETGTARFQRFAESYRQKTTDDAEESGAGVGLLAALAATIVTGGAALPVLAAGGVGFMVGADGTAKVDRDRVVVVLDQMFGGVAIEQLRLPYVTFYQQKDGDGLKVVDARSGNLAQAIGRSIANPFIFERLDVVAAGQLDPGGDRVSATPVEDTCRLFPGHRIIAFNVTGQHAVFTKAMNCQLDEIMIDVGDVDATALFSGDQDELERVAMIGWRAAAPHFGLPNEPYTRE